METLLIRQIATAYHEQRVDNIHEFGEVCDAVEALLDKINPYFNRLTYGIIATQLRKKRPSKIEKRLLFSTNVNWKRHINRIYFGYI